MSGTACWQVSVTVTAGAFKAFEAAFEPHCEAVTCFPIGDESIWQVTGFSRAAPDKPVLTAAVAAVAAALGLPVPAMKIAPVSERDWELESFSNFPPVRIGRFYIFGSHEADPPPPGAFALCLDAGLAFGTGKHASTAGVLAALDRLSRAYRFKRVLDMGTGSGILAMSIVKAWRARVTACDIDPRAVRTCAANLRLNGLHPHIRALVTQGYRSRAVNAQAPYDLIVSNILANPLCAMAGDLEAHLAPGGFAILSGFLLQDWRRVLAAHRSRGLLYRGRAVVDDWVTLTVQRSSEKAFKIK
ncbi:MAG: 50S ribosomal protein L11 methyltransferase [Rhodospirillales bacterium]